MDFELYKYGLQNALDSIIYTLEDALNTKNKNEMTKYISEAYGMVKAIDMLIVEKDMPIVEKNEEDNG